MDVSKASKLVQRLCREIEEARIHANWVNVPALAEQLRSKDNKYALLADFYATESKLEACFANAYRDDQRSRRPGDFLHLSVETKSILDHVATHLDRVSAEVPSNEQWSDDVHTLVPLLECKVAFLLVASAEDHAKFVDRVARFGVERICATRLQTSGSQQQQVRLYRLLAETLAMRAIAMENSPQISASKFKRLEHEEKVNNCYDQACDVAFGYLQALGQKELLQPTLSSRRLHSRYVGSLLHTAMLRGPKLHIRHRQPVWAIARYREMLRVTHPPASQVVRLDLAQRLARLLLCNSCGRHYMSARNMIAPKSPMMAGTLRAGKAT